MKLILKISANAAADSLRRVAPRLITLRRDLDQYRPTGASYEALEVHISTAYSGETCAQVVASNRIITACCGLDFYEDLSPSGDDAFLRFILGKIREAITVSPLAEQDRESYLSFVRRYEA